ncbi:hypothetical protein [Maricaulis sp.]|uniref:CC0125/CC1285 family lipoprotein n=1 Tax=Maricaulis sp. TaxID=1486257 RepID=UPI000C4C8AF6|nr:hypothetical protein [Maricaulis sp.]MAC88337.1 hypothetical protein [Maricaulis sp.]
MFRDLCRIVGVSLALFTFPVEPAFAKQDDSSTPYRNSFLGSSGLSDRQLDDATWRLRFRGVATKAELDDYFLLKAAEIGQEEGYGYFLISDPVFENQRSIRYLNCSETVNNILVCDRPRGEGQPPLELRAETLIEFVSEPVAASHQVSETYDRLAPLYIDADD